MATKKHLRLGATVYHRNNPAYGIGVIRYVRKPHERNHLGKRTKKRYLVRWAERAALWDDSFHTANELTPDPPTKPPFRERKKSERLRMYSKTHRKPAGKSKTRQR
jgi:hypothetical protein